MPLPFEAIARAETQSSNGSASAEASVGAKCVDERALAILAKTIYRELRAEGYATRDLIGLAGELIGLVSAEVRGPTEDA
jgi:hypothetical protein